MSAAIKRVSFSAEPVASARTRLWRLKTSGASSATMTVTRM
jgi:hypothetical protein